MVWIRISKDDGIREPVEESRVFRAARDYFVDPHLAMLAAKEGADLNTPFAIYRFEKEARDGR